MRLFSWPARNRNIARKKQHAAPSIRHRRAFLEALEDRSLLAVTALVGGNLTITDTPGTSNQLTITNDGASNLVITDTAEGFASTGGISGATLSNGNKTLTVPIASITGAQIVINGTDGDDTAHR